MHRARSGQEHWPWPSLQDEQGPARAASSCAHVQGPAEHNCRRKSTTLETAPSLERQGAACSSRSPPDLHLPYLARCLPFLSGLGARVPGYRLLRNCPSLLPLLPWLQPGACRQETTRHSSKDRRGTALRYGTVRNGTERHSQSGTATPRRLSSQPRHQKRPRSPTTWMKKQPALCLAQLLRPPQPSPAPA